MITNEVLQGGRVNLRQLELADCGSHYLAWLNDPDINRYMETKWSIWDPESIRKFVEIQRQSSHSVLFAVIERLSGKHIGNLKIGPVHPHYRHADISYFIGDKKCMGRLSEN